MLKNMLTSFMNVWVCECSVKSRCQRAPNQDNIFSLKSLNLIAKLHKLAYLKQVCFLLLTGIDKLKNKQKLCITLVSNYYH